MVTTSSLFSILNELVSKTAPQWLYTYKPKPWLRIGSLGLSTVLVVYGVTFADMTWLSAKKRYEWATEEERLDWKYWIKTYGPLGLTFLPFTLSLGTLWTFSRVVTKIELVSKHSNVNSNVPMFRVVRLSAVMGKPKENLININHLVKSKNSRIFTGNGDQGIEDRGTFCFYLMNTAAGVKFWDKHYIISRSGKIWKSDGKLLESLFNDGPGTVSSSKSKNRPRHSILQEIIQLNQEKNKNKHSFHIKSIKQKNIIKDIILNTEKK
ncbi:hypothetical protein RI543_003892 [Arxiozyma heterogenica]|uniref:Uncharacterized protein n=1 Tax=Arxiozyma heterogenica TaxID=278026 RepID=A0AAN7WKS8_9SACH|nr:hypothetical protein RI543_003892 [Kazachstania heterogenica]